MTVHPPGSVPLLLALVWTATISGADDTQSVPPESIDPLIATLTSDSFIQRDWAERRLMNAGDAVVPHLAAAVHREPTAAAALVLLVRMSQKQDNPAASHALSALVTLWENADQLPEQTRATVEQAYRSAIRRSIAQLTILGADTERNEQQHIVRVRIRSREFGDQQLAILTPLTTLQVLDLRDTSITDEGLSQLASLRRLKSLNLSDTEITGEGLRRLAPLTTLEELILYRIPVASEHREWCRQHLPQCQITHH